VRELLDTHAETIGFWAAFLTTIAFVPQVIRSWRAGGRELSWLMLSSLGIGVGLWFVYGYLRDSAPLMLANSATGVQVLLLFAIKLRTTRRHGSENLPADL
jgi:MtN3 and saliva related transmembrane protein